MSGIRSSHLSSSTCEPNDIRNELEDGGKRVTGNPDGVGRDYRRRGLHHRLLHFGLAGTRGRGGMFDVLFILGP